MIGYIYSVLGNLNLKIFKLEKAIKFFELALKYNTKNVAALYNFGVVLLQQGNFLKALECLEKAKDLNKKVLYKKYIDLALSSVYWKLNNIDKGIEILENLRKEFEYVSPDLLTTLGYFYLLKEDYKNALEFSKKAIEDTETFFAAWDNIGQIYFYQKDYEKAYEYFKKACKYKQDSVDSLYYLGLIEEINKNFEKAYEYFEKANKCAITSLNTVSKKQIEEKIKSLQK